MSSEVIGIVEKCHEVTEIEWNITDFFTITENKNFVNSPLFTFFGTLWRLQLKLKSDTRPGFMCLFLGNENETADCSLSYNLGLKKLDGTVKLLSEGIFKEKCKWTEAHYINLSDIQQRKAELAASNVLIIKCMLKHGTAHSDQLKKLKVPVLEELIKLETLCENFKSLFSNKKSCDTTLLVMDKEYKAHRAVLIARSSVFAAMFLHETSEKQTGIVTIPDCDPESFNKFLEFLYTGKLEKSSSRSLLHLYETSDKYDIQELKTFCSEFLIQNMVVDDVCDVVILADKYDDTKLLSAAQSFFNKNLNKIFLTSEWDCLLTNNRRLANELLLKMSKMKEVN